MITYNTLLGNGFDEFDRIANWIENDMFIVTYC